MQITPRFFPIIDHFKCREHILVAGILLSWRKHVDTLCLDMIISSLIPLTNDRFILRLNGYCQKCTIPWSFWETNIKRVCVALVDFLRIYSSRWCWRKQRVPVLVEIIHYTLYFIGCKVYLYNTSLRLNIRLRPTK